MALKSDSELGINSWLEDEIYGQYLRDRSAVDERWRDLFEAHGVAPPPAPCPLSSAGRCGPVRDAAAGLRAWNSNRCAARPAASPET